MMRAEETGRAYQSWEIEERVGARMIITFVCRPDMIFQRIVA